MLPDYVRPHQYSYGNSGLNPLYMAQVFGQPQLAPPDASILPPSNTIPTINAPPPAAATPTPVPNTPAAPTPASPATPAEPAAPSLDELRTQFLNQAMQGFGTNYGRQLIGDNMLDDTIMSIMGEQRGNAQQYLDRGLARGIYNDVGYGAGQNRINTTSEAAQSQLSGLGTSVLDKYRGQANEVRDRAFGTISGLLPGQEFSLDPYFEEGNSVRSTAERNASGDLRSALGGTNFFDFSGLTNAAGMAQGAQNLRDTDVATALGERRRRSEQGRGLGSQGAF